MVGRIAGVSGCRAHRRHKINRCCVSFAMGKFVAEMPTRTHCALVIRDCGPEILPAEGLAGVTTN